MRWKDKTMHTIPFPSTTKALETLWLSRLENHSDLTFLRTTLSSIFIRNTAFMTKNCKIHHIGEDSQFHSQHLGQVFPEVIQFFQSNVSFQTQLHYSKWFPTSPLIYLIILRSEYHRYECETSNVRKGFNRTFETALGKSLDKYRPDLPGKNIFGDEVKDLLHLSS